MNKRIFLLLTLLFTLTNQAVAKEVRIAVAANFTSVARQLAPLFEQQTGYKTKISYGSTGKLYAQIEHGAPFDIFMAADSEYPKKAIAQGLAVADSRFIYAQGTLVLWSPSNKLFDNSDLAATRYLQQADFKHLAIGNPKTAPYGLAAQQVLKHLSLWDALQDKLVRGDSISQAFQFVATENAALGFVALSQAKAWQQKIAKSSGTFWHIPASYYAPIEQSAVLLKRGKENKAALAFISFLKSETTREFIMQKGYSYRK
jgi:molybdate transport system substrate-binding protein